MFLGDVSPNIVCIYSGIIPVLSFCQIYIYIVYVNKKKVILLLSYDYDDLII